MEWQAASLERARKIVAAGMRCKLDGEGLRISAISECLRAMSHLSSVSLGGRGSWEPAASIRLTSMVRRRLTPLWPNLAADGEDTCPGVMDVLDTLAELGDMVRLQGGMWLVAPVRAVCAGDGLAMLLGGGPTVVLPQAVAGTATVAGRARFVESATCEGWVDLWQADEWIGAPPEGLQAWSVRLLAETAVRLTDAPEDVGETSVYMHREWIRLADLAADERGLHLCKARIGAGSPYFIGEFFRGRLRRLSTIASTDARRLRFQLDAQVGRPVRIRTTALHGLVHLHLRRRLPEKEAKVLLLGWQIPTPKGEYPGATHYVFPQETLPIVRQAFEGLQIVLDERIGTTEGN